MNEFANINYSNRFRPEASRRKNLWTTTVFPDDLENNTITSITRTCLGR